MGGSGGRLAREGLGRHHHGALIVVRYRRTPHSVLWGLATRRDEAKDLDVQTVRPPTAASTSYGFDRLELRCCLTAYAASRS
jgi:hypothetical protein